MQDDIAADDDGDEDSLDEKMRIDPAKTNIADLFAKLSGV